MVAAITFLPLLGALVAGLFCRVLSATQAAWVTVIPMVVAAVLAGNEFYHVALLGQSYTQPLLPWIMVGDFQADWALKVDSLTAVMLVVVTWVSTVVHIYSVGYMHHDPHQQRFMAYLSLFTFFMLMLVTADNFLQLFVGWEGVGLASYLLIGFWFKRESANAASMKAFIVNRVGDFGMVLGVFTVYVLFGTIEFDAIFAAAPAKQQVMLSFLGMEGHGLTIACLLLFVGCMGKSAQLGLHTWLPDAMEGPTPVSALIHAATMVTAGVFLLVRCSPLFELAPVALQVVTVVGACTAFFAATVGLVQNDIKKVIAYSTCSQLGYMFFACGVGAYPAAVFHLMTHAFFKALLFLGAGSVIHGMSDEQDMRRMGGIWKKLPITYGYMWLGSLALAGIPVFAGYYSKDMILEAAYAAHSPFGLFAFWMGIAAAFMTAFYSWRLLFMTFHGTTRASDEVYSHVHESPAIMNAPLILLALGALASGWLGYHWLGMVDADLAFWKGAIVLAESNQVLEHAHHVPGWVPLLPFGIGLAGIGLAYVFYMLKTEWPSSLARFAKAPYRFLLHKWYFDELYHHLFVVGAQLKGNLLWRFGDIRLIDGLGPNGLAHATQWVAARFSRAQTGYVYHYALAMVLGLVGLLGYLVWRLGLSLTV